MHSRSKRETYNWLRCFEQLTIGRDIGQCLTITFLASEGRRWNRVIAMKENITGPRPRLIEGSLAAISMDNDCKVPVHVKIFVFERMADFQLARKGSGYSQRAALTTLTLSSEDHKIIRLHTVKCNPNGAPGVIYIVASTTRIQGMGRNCGSAAATTAPSGNRAGVPQRHLGVMRPNLKVRKDPTFYHQERTIVLPYDVIPESVQYSLEAQPEQPLSLLTVPNLHETSLQRPTGLWQGGPGMLDSKQEVLH